MKFFQKSGGKLGTFSPRIRLKRQKNDVTKEGFPMKKKNVFTAICVVALLGAAVALEKARKKKKNKDGK